MASDVGLAVQELCKLIKEFSTSVLWVEYSLETDMAARIRKVSLFFGLETDESARAEIPRDHALVEPSAARFFLAAETWVIDKLRGEPSENLTQIVLDSFNDLQLVTDKMRTPARIDVIAFLSAQMDASHRAWTAYNRVNGVRDVSQHFKIGRAEATRVVKVSGFEFDDDRDR